MAGYSPSHYSMQKCHKCGKEFQCVYIERYCEECDGLVYGDG